MQHGKSTNKNKKRLEQIEKVSNSSDSIVESINQVIGKFNVKALFATIEQVKRNGVKPSKIATVLLILPFIGVSNIAAMIKSGLSRMSEGEKDVYYDLKNNSKLSWRHLLFGFAKRFEYLASLSDQEKTDVKQNIKQIKALIFDDSPLEKTGKKIEGIGYIHDHVQNIYILGYKLLVCGYWDGVSFIPLDFSLHKEKGDGKLKKAKVRLEKQRARVKKQKQEVSLHQKKLQAKKEIQKEAQNMLQAKTNKTNKKQVLGCKKAVAKAEHRLQKIEAELARMEQQQQFLMNELSEIKANYREGGLDKKEIINQYKKERERNTPTYKRKQELSSSKIDSVIKMIKRVLRKGFDFDYILTDSWFFSAKLLKAVLSAKRKIHLVSMAKISNAKYMLVAKKKYYAPKQIVALYERKHSHISRKYKAKYITFVAHYQGIEVRIFLVSFGNSSWRMLVTTDLRMNFVQIMEVYKIRWTIEVFFKESKQHLLLGKSQSLDFDAQIADITLSLMRYILLSYYERIHYGYTIGALFRNIKQASIEENLVADITIYFFALVNVFANRAGIDLITFYEDLLTDPQAGIILKRLNLNLENMAAS